jgi:DNA-binding XRE family transcriptional regulator
MAEHANVYPLRREPSPEPRPRHTAPQAPQPQPQEPQPQPRPPQHQEPQPQLRPQPQHQEPQHQEPLWREALGRRLRVLRLEQEETLSQTAGRAGISPQYLSEIERGRKEPSSEMIAALAGALGTTLTGLTEQVAGDLRRRRPSGPVMLALAA